MPCTIWVRRSVRNPTPTNKKTAASLMAYSGYCYEKDFLHSCETLTVLLILFAHLTLGDLLLEYDRMLPQSHLLQASCHLWSLFSYTWCAALATFT